jgi:hypothetical protein
LVLPQSSLRAAFLFLNIPSPRFTGRQKSGAHVAMADTTFQIGVTFDNSTATAGLTQLNSAFQSTTSAVAGMWAQASSTVTVALKNISTEAENTAGRTKEQIEKAILFLLQSDFDRRQAQADTEDGD